MAARTVEGVDGRTWTIRRRVVWPRWRFAPGGFPPIELDPTGILLLLFFPLLLAFVLVLLFSAVALIAEAVAVLVAAYIWRGRWIIEATDHGQPGETRSWEVRGWSGSRRKVVEVARELEAGAGARAID